MSASQKATGGRRTKTAEERSAQISALNSVRQPSPVAERPPRGRSVDGGLGPLSTESARSKLPKPPQGHGGYERKVWRKLPRREGTAPRYTNQSAKQQMLEAARLAALERGYEAMRISEVTDPIGVTRQAFYAHFRDKRHCMAEAIDPKLGAIERMAASLSVTDAEAAARVAHALDDLIAERFGSPEGTRGRIVGAMIELLRETGSFHKVRIGALVKAAHVPPGDFYRQFSGKGECFAVAYEQLLGELIAEVHESVAQDASGSAEPRHEVPESPAEHTRHEIPALLRSLAKALNADPERRRILIVEMAHLPDQAPGDVDGARKAALRLALAELLAPSAGLPPDDSRLVLTAASLIEVIRSAELADDAEELASRLVELDMSLMTGRSQGAVASRPLAA